MILCHSQSHTHSVFQCPLRHCVSGGAVNGCKGGEWVDVQAGVRLGGGPPTRSPPWPRSDITASFVSAPAEHQLACRSAATGEQLFVLHSRAAALFCSLACGSLYVSASQETGWCGSK